MALRSDGTVVEYGLYPAAAWTNGVPQTWQVVSPGLSNIVAVAAGWENNLALRSDGTVFAWGMRGQPRSDFPNGAGEIKDGRAIAAGFNNGSLILRQDGTIIEPSPNAEDREYPPPAGLTNVVAIAARGSVRLALVSDAPGVRPLLSSGWNAPDVSLVAATELGKRYHVEYTDSLDPKSWTILPPVFGDGTEKAMMKLQPTAAARFYRLRVQ